MDRLRDLKIVTAFNILGTELKIYVTAISSSTTRFRSGKATLNQYITPSKKCSEGSPGTSLRLDHPLHFKTAVRPLN